MGSELKKLLTGAERARVGTGITREGLYKALSPTGNPEFSTILKVIKALKIKLHASAGGKP